MWLRCINNTIITAVRDVPRFADHHEHTPVSVLVWHHAVSQLVHQPMRTHRSFHVCRATRPSWRAHPPRHRVAGCRRPPFAQRLRRQVPVKRKPTCCAGVKRVRVLLYVQVKHAQARRGPTPHHVFLKDVGHPADLRHNEIQQGGGHDHRDANGGAGVEMKLDPACHRQVGKENWNTWESHGNVCRRPCTTNSA